jgi:hypothetical protein
MGFGVLRILVALLDAFANLGHRLGRDGLMGDHFCRGLQGWKKELGGGSIGYLDLSFGSMT